MVRAFGLPGNTGSKAHSAYMLGYITACKGKEKNIPDHFKSRACTKAYEEGFNKGSERTYRIDLDDF